MGELESTEQKHLCQIAQAELVSQPAQHDLEDNIRGELEEIEWSACALIGLAPTLTATEFSVAEVRGLIQLPELGRLAMGADHGATVRHSRVTTQPTSSLPRPES